VITIDFYTLLRMLLNRKSVTLPHVTDEPVSAMLKRLEGEIKQPFIYKIVRDKTIIPGTIILINGENVLHLEGLNSTIPESATIALFPPGAGG